MNANVREIGSAGQDSLMASVAPDGEAVDQIAARALTVRDQRPPQVANRSP